AAGYLAKTWGAEQFADLDPEAFFDFQATRPHVSLEEGLTRRIDWPETAFYHARPEGLDRDVVLLLGIEPNLRWRTFSDLVVGLAGDLGIELMITLGALLADVPHTRPAPVTGSATDEELVERLGLSASRYQGPPGVAGGPPHVSPPPAPRGGGRGAGGAGRATLIGATVDGDELEEAARSYEEQVSEAVASDEETAAYVEELERRRAQPEEAT